MNMSSTINILVLGWHIHGNAHNSPFPGLPCTYQAIGMKPCNLDPRGRKGGREGGREGGRQGARERGRDKEREGGRERERETEREGERASASRLLQSVEVCNRAG